MSSPAARRRAPGASSGSARKGLRSKAGDPVDPHQVAAVLDRLAGEMSRHMARLHGPVDGARGLARSIGAGVSVCQRVLSGMNARGTAAERLAQWPSAAGVRLVADRLHEAVGAGGNRSTLALAVRAYEQLIQSIATSHARAVRIVRAHEAATRAGAIAPALGPASLESRRTLARAATEVLGYAIDACVFVVAVRPLPDRPELMEGCSAVGLIGIRTHGRRVCITSQNTQLRQVAGDLAGEVRWTPLGSPLTPGGRDGVLSEFCNPPMPLSAVDEGDGVIRQVVESTQDPSNLRGVDVVLARHWSPDNNPQHTPSPSWSQVLRLRHSVRRMVMDVYLHKSMLSAQPPVVGAYYWHPALPSDPRRNWQDRLPTAPSVSLLNPSSPAPTTAWARQRELTSRMFELVGWPADDFVGFRCEESFPIWGAAYYMTFDLAPR